jgi:dual specificity phosphatase 12
MDEVIPGLWIGDFPSALNIDQLKANNICSILSAMRGRFTIHKVRQIADCGSQ